MHRSIMSTRRFPGRVVATVFWLVLVSPGCHGMDPPENVIYHVNSFRVPCVGVAPMSCLQVQRGEEATGDWQYFYSSIDGFDFEPGYVYRLLVRETHLPREQVPADASSIRYELVEILSKMRDPRLAIHDIWVLVRIGNEPVDALRGEGPSQAPYIEFNVARGEYLGHDGCSDIQGSILALDSRRVRLGPPVPSSTPPDSCRENTLPARLSAALMNVSQWRRDGLDLTLLDDNDTALLVFRKTD